MAKYVKKPVEVEAEIFKEGMEDGYGAYKIFTGEFIGWLKKEQSIPKTNLKPAIKTLEGWYEVQEGEHYIVTGIEGERYPVKKEIFEKTYELVEEEEGIIYLRYKGMVYKGVLDKDANIYVITWSVQEGRFSIWSKSIVEERIKNGGWTQIDKEEYDKFIIYQ